jgi:putative peptide maturation system protein
VTAALDPDLLAGAARVLIHLTTSQATPAAALARIREFDRAHPGVESRLVWQREAYDNSLHFDLLLQGIEQGTVAISFCPDGELPWPMRGAQRWNEEDLVRVNDTVLKVQDAVSLLDFVWEERRLATRLVDVCLVREELERNPIALSTTELRQALDDFRARRRLLSAAATRDWMSERGLSHSQLERLVAEEERMRRLRRRLSEGEIERYFDLHRADFARAAIILVPCDYSVAQTQNLVPYEVVRDALRRHLSTDTAPPPRFCTITRSDRWTELVRHAFTAEVGTVSGPISDGAGSWLMIIVARTEPTLDRLTREEVEKHLFERWLADRRRTARIEWFWGYTSVTEALTEAMQDPR